MKSLLIWFDIHKKSHLEAFKHLRETGRWPDGFLPDDIEIPMHWHYLIANKIADEYVDEKLSHWESGK